MKNKLIYTAFSPNTRFKDLRENALLLAFPLIRWIDGSSLDSVDGYFRKHYPEHEVFLYNYARSAMFEFFSAVKHDDADEVVFQGYTCAAASLPAIWAGYNPVYADVNETNLSMDVKSLSKVVTSKTKIIVIQYTLGQVPDLEAILDYAKKKKILVLEDCTHYLPSTVDKKYGDRGDAAIFSLGRDKVASGIDGGILTTNNPKLEGEIRSRYVHLTPPPIKWIVARLHFAPLWWAIRNLWRSKIGKLIHLITTKIGLLSRATSPEEKLGLRPEYIPSTMPNAMAQIAFTQLEDIDKLQIHRRKIAEIYRRELKGVDGIQMFEVDAITPLRFPVMVSSDIRDQLVSDMEEENIILGDWYTKPVAPVEISDRISQYVSGSCIESEKISARMINLPTHINISIDDALYVSSELRSALAHLRKT